jgi:predicted nucleotidyltransferase
MMDKTPAILSAHPIEDKVRARIMEALDQIEAEHQVKVLIACESGSRGWGFASPDSDYDVRFVYAHALPWYLTVHGGRDVIELPIDDELDVNGWELRKALQLLRKSNPTLLEWLDSPVIYRADSGFAARMRSFVPAFFSGQGVRHHYLSMAKKNFRGYLQGESVRLKKYLYVLRPLLAVRWIDNGRGMPPMRFADLAAATLNDSALIGEINCLLDLKMRADETEYSPRWPAIHDFIVDELARAERSPQHGKHNGDTRELDRFLFETVQTFSNH